MNTELQSRLSELRARNLESRNSLVANQSKVRKIENLVLKRLLEKSGMSEFRTTVFNRYYSSIRVVVSEAQVSNLLANNPKAKPKDGIVVRVGVKDPKTRKVVKTNLYNSNAELIHQEDGVMK